MQTDLQKLREYRDNLEAFKTNQDNKAATMAEELEATSEWYYYTECSINYCFYMHSIFLF